MKNLKKVLAVMTAVTAMAASTSAFAADANTVAFTGDFEGKGTYAIPEGGSAYKFGVTTDFADTTKGDMTLLVLTEGALTTEDTEVSDEEILYIDQGTTGFTGLGLKTITVDGEAKEVIDVPTTGDGYIVKVGYYDANGNFQIAKGNFTITAPVVEPEEPDVPPQPAANTITLKWGDLNADTYVDTTDALLAILAYGGTNSDVTMVGSTGTVNVAVGDKITSAYAVSNDTIVWGDLNADEYVDTTDALLAILAYGGTNSDVTVGGNNISVGATNATVDLTNKTITFVAE